MSNPLDIRTYITQVSQALVETIDLAYRYRYPEAQNLQELAALPSLPLPHRALRFVVEEGVCYRLIVPSTLAHNPPHVIQPIDRPKNGRWIRTYSTVTLGPDYRRPLHRVRNGYARAVQQYQGEEGEELEKIFGQWPGFLVEWVQDDLSTKSTVPGGRYWSPMQFVIHAMFRDFRQGNEALEGINLPSDPVPGINRMIGDIRYLLANSDLGLGPGVQYCEIQGSAKIVQQDLAQRAFVAEIPIQVLASVHRADEDLIPLEEVWIQEQLADTRGLAIFDQQNYVHKGYRFDWGNGFTESPSSGIALINGQLVASSPGPWTFAPNKDTYRDLGIDGRLRYNEVEVGEVAPLQEDGTLRIGYTRTDSYGITNDFLLCCTLEDYGDPYRVPKYQ